MAEKLAELKQKGGSGGSSGYNLYNWPNMSDATAMTIYSSRIKNVTKNGYKKIGTDVFIELEGTLNFSTGSSLATYALTNFPSSVLTGGIVGNYEILMDSSFAFVRGAGVSTDNYFNIYSSSSGSSNTSISIKMIYHNQ